MQDQPISEQESLNLIEAMIRKAKNAYRDTGRSATMWGIVVAVCSFVKFLEVTYHFTLPFDIYWLTFVAIIPQVIISVKEKKNRLVKSYDDVYMDYIWLAFGICIMLLVLVLNVLGNALEETTVNYKTTAGADPDFQLYEYVSPLFLILYGMPTFITGAACKFRPMLLGGLICWACCIITVFTDIKIDLLLVSFSAIVAWLIPGLIMMRDYRKAKKELSATNV